MNRRAFLRGAAAVGGGLLGLDVGPASLGVPAPVRSAARPNILVVMVDEMRYPQWFPEQGALDGLLPNIARIRAGAVSFGQHHAAANQCRPARACLLTGLYAHQTYCLLTLDSPLPPRLDPGFPTWGTALRGLGYQAVWYGKWHLSFGCDVSRYGFDGGTCPSPDGFPGDGLRCDAQIADQFIAWLQAHGNGTPWCTTVSFVNPHDVASYYRGTDIFPVLRNPPSVFSQLPPNFETPDDMAARAKPRLQRAWIDMFASQQGGPLPYSGDGFAARWLKLLDVYLRLQQLVDVQIGRVLDALATSGAAENTIIIFTSDHGDYGGSHGMRGKAYGAYDEAVRVPLYVKDPTGRFIGSTSQPEVERPQLTSSVDLMPLLMTLARDDRWRDPQSPYGHLAGRLDLAALLRDPAAPGRNYILHTADEQVTASNSPAPNSGVPPTHVIAYRTPSAKLGLYSYWKPGTSDICSDGEELECYDYRTDSGRKELDNVAGTSLSNQLYATLTNKDNGVIQKELRQPLPPALLPVQQAALKAYLGTPDLTTFLPLIMYH